MTDRPPSKFTPHAYQKQGAQFILDRQRCALFWDMGLGKTGTVLHAIERAPMFMLPALIVAPLRCVTKVWPAEIDKFSFPFSYSIVHGDDVEGRNYGLKFTPGENRAARLAENTDIKLTNYESLAWLLGELQRRREVPFKTVIFDELSKLKSPTSKRTNYAQAISAHCHYRIGLTGTPIPAGYHDIWAQAYTLDHGETFGSYQNFLSTAFTEDHNGRPVLLPGWGETIEQVTRRFALRGDADELLEMPPLVEQTVRIELDDDFYDRYDEIEYGYLNGLDDIEAHTEAPYAALRCAASGFIYRHNPLTNVRELEILHDEKLNEIQTIHDELNGKPVLVAFNFRGERQQLVERFGCAFIDGSTSNRNADRLVNEWNAGRLPMLAIHPLAVGFGLNMQAGGRHLIWYSLPDGGDQYAQTVARIYRQGQTGTVYVYRLVCDDTIEKCIDGLLRRKILTQDNLLDAIKQQHEQRAKK